MPGTVLHHPNNPKGNFSTECSSVSPSSPPKFQWLQSSAFLTIGSAIFKGFPYPYNSGKTQGHLGVPWIPPGCRPELEFVASGPHCSMEEPLQAGSPISVSAAWVPSALQIPVPQCQRPCTPEINRRRFLLYYIQL